jgi:hypothetical protein
LDLWNINKLNLIHFNLKCWPFVFTYISLCAVPINTATHYFQTLSDYSIHTVMNVFKLLRVGLFAALLACILLAGRLLALWSHIEAVRSSEMFMDFCWSPQWQTTEVNTLHGHCCENLKYNMHNKEDKDDLHSHLLSYDNCLICTCSWPSQSHRSSQCCHLPEECFLLPGLHA